MEVGHALVSSGNPTQHRCVSLGVLARFLSVEKLDKVDTHSVPGGGLVRPVLVSNSTWAH